MKFSNNYETFASAKAFKDYTEATRSTQGSDPTEWDGTNNKCKEPFCGVELDMNDYDDTCNNCFNQVEPEEKEETQNK